VRRNDGEPMLGAIRTVTGSPLAVIVELPRRQALLEASTTVERLEALVKLLDREVMLLASRLRLFAPDPRLLRGPRRS
jgi:hypothetical protein